MTSFLLFDGLFITMDEKQRIFSNGAVYIEDDTIHAIGPVNEVRQHYPHAEHEIDLANHIVLPGLIDCHCHTVQSLHRYLGTDLALVDWLKQGKLPFQRRITQKDAALGAQLGILEALRFGSISLVENYIPTAKNSRNLDEIGKVAEQFGIRCVLARMVGDNPKTMDPTTVQSIPVILQEYRRLYARFHGKADGRLQIAVSPGSFRNATKDGLKALGAYATEKQLIVHTHVSESKQVADQVKKRFGKHWIEVADECGLLSNRFQAAHGVWLTPPEIKLLSSAGATVVYNPASNMALASGVAPVPQLIQAGVNVAFGGDSAGCNFSLDLLSHLGLGALLQKVHTLNPKALNAYQVLEMATRNGAKALGQEASLGSLEVGKKADLIAIDTQQSHLQPLHDPVAAVVYGATGTDVSHVMIDGQLILQDKEFVTLDQQQIMHTAVSRAYAIREEIEQDQH